MSPKETLTLSPEDLKLKGLTAFEGLLGKAAEINFFQRIEDFARQNSACPGQEHFLEDYKVKLTLHPAHSLPAICALSDEGIRPTVIGLTIQIFDRKLKEAGIKPFFILDFGAAKEVSCSAKPQHKRRFNKDKPYKTTDFNLQSGPPPFDADLVLVINDPSVPESTIQQIFESIPIAPPLKLKFSISQSRPLARAEIVGQIPLEAFSWERRERKYSLAQIAFPELNGIHHPSIPLIAFVLSQDTNARFVLLVPTDAPGGFIGVEINFHPYRQIPSLTFEQKNRNGELIRRHAEFAFIDFFSEAFPIKDSPPEAFAHFCHFLRECTWDDRVRLIWEEEDDWTGIFIDQKSYQKAINRASKNTALRFAQEIVYPIAQNPSLIVNNATSMRHNVNRTFDGLEGLLNGDPYLGYQYLLPAGLNLTDAPVYGLGIIDPRGLFPKLFQFLSEKGRFEDLLHVMERCDWGAAQLGWPTFVAYIYEQTGRNLRQIDELLCPVFCSNEVFPTLVDNYVRKALVRFYDIPLRNPLTGTFPQPQFKKI
jgi:hypothetical protein